MSSTDFNKQLILDDRIANLTDKIDYAVMKGAQTISVADVNATSKSPTSLVFNAVVPSLETIVDRRIMLRVSLILKIDGTVNTADKQLILRRERLSWELSYAFVDEYAFVHHQ